MSESGVADQAEGSSENAARTPGAPMPEAVTVPPVVSGLRMAVPASGPAGCPTCGAMAGGSDVASAYVYAIGRIEPRFPLLSVEKEIAQATGRAHTANLSDRQALHKTLSDPQNRYLARQMCWVVTIGGIETYLIFPRDPMDLQLLVESLRGSPRPTDLNVVIGMRGPLASPDMCNGLIVPVVTFDQIYSFDRDGLIRAIPAPEGAEEERFRATAEEVFDRIIQIADNAGATNEHRALNYLAMRYPALYATVAAAHHRNAALSAVDVRPSDLSGTRQLVDVIFSFTDRATDVLDRFYVRVDVSEEFPFLVTKMSPYLAR